MTGAQFSEEVGGLVKVPNPDKQPREDLEGQSDEDDEESTIEVVKDMDKFKLIVSQLKVLARSSPSDKYLLVTGLR